MEGRGLAGAFSERGSLTRSTSASTKGSGLHHTDLTSQLAAGRKPALRLLLGHHPLFIAPRQFKRQKRIAFQPLINADFQLSDRIALACLAVAALERRRVVACLAGLSRRSLGVGGSEAKAQGTAHKLFSQGLSCRAVAASERRREGRDTKRTMQNILLTTNAQKQICDPHPSYTLCHPLCPKLCRQEQWISPWRHTEIAFTANDVTRSPRQQVD